MVRPAGAPERLAKPPRALIPSHVSACRRADVLIEQRKQSVEHKHGVKVLASLKKALRAYVRSTCSFEAAMEDAARAAVAASEWDLVSRLRATALRQPFIEHFWRIVHALRADYPDMPLYREAMPLLLIVQQAGLADDKRAEALTALGGLLKDPNEAIKTAAVRDLVVFRAAGLLKAASESVHTATAKAADAVMRLLDDSGEWNAYLTRLASPRVCSACGKLESGATKLKQCARCKAAMYCSRECQVAAWPTHKAGCSKV